MTNDNGPLAASTSRQHMRRYLTEVIIALTAILAASPARGDHRVGDICRIKGQEENILHGFGLVIGLKGTGDGDMKPTQRALGHYMELLGHRVATAPGSQGAQASYDELKNAKNVALVYVTATVPPGGAQQGDLLDLNLSASSAKSLDGGYLMLTELHGPVPGDKTVYALAKGYLSIDDPARQQTARVPLGCQLERKIENRFMTSDGKVILVMNKDHATFQTASDVERAINNERDFYTSSGERGIARAIDQVTIDVTIPASYSDNPALFAATLLSTRLAPAMVDTRVIINERKQAIIVGADVEINPVVVMHKNRIIQVGDQQLQEAVAFNPRGDSSRPKLESLVAALNLLKVPTGDVIDIIKMLKHKRALFGELIIE